MGKKTAIKELEYEDFIATLKNLHTNNLEMVDEVIQKIQTLNSQGGGFYFTEITPKVNSLLADLTVVKCKIETAYIQSEELIKEFLTVVDDMDTME